MRLQVGIAVALLMVVSAMLAEPEGSSRARRLVQIAGTYSDLTYNEEAGDLLGMEVKIVPTGAEGYQAAIIVSEGAPHPMVLADVRVDGPSVSFDVHEGGEQSWSFRGVASAQSLKGTITHSLGGRQDVTLKRQCGYWDR